MIIYVRLLARVAVLEVN